MKTMALSLSFLRAMSPALLRVAALTVTPPMSTGSSAAAGVSLPVRPTSHLTLSSRVVISSASNLKAMAQRGKRSV